MPKHGAERKTLTFLLRDIPKITWTKARMRALQERRSMNETIIAALVEYSRGEKVGRAESYKTKRGK